VKFTWNDGTTFECEFNKNFGFLKGKSINCYDHVFEGEVEFEERGPLEPPQVWNGVTKMHFERQSNEEQHQFVEVEVIYEGGKKVRMKGKYSNGGCWDVDYPLDGKTKGRYTKSNGTLFLPVEQRNGN